MPKQGSTEQGYIGVLGTSTLIPSLLLRGSPPSTIEARDRCDGPDVRLLQPESFSLYDHLGGHAL